MSRAERFGAGIGIAILLFYIASTTQLIDKANALTLALAFAIGPVAIVGVRRLADTLEPDLKGATLGTARLFLVVAFVLFTVMVVVQQMVGLQFQQFLAQAPDPASTQALRVVYRGVNLVQLGLDVSFDIFYCLGVIALGATVYQHPSFGRLVGGLGIVSGAALLMINLAAFPKVPVEVGLVDVGPVTGLWWLLLIGLQIRRRRQNPPSLVAA